MLLTAFFRWGHWGFDVLIDGQTRNTWHKNQNHQFYRTISSVGNSGVFVSQWKKPPFSNTPKAVESTQETLWSLVHRCTWIAFLASDLLARKKRLMRLSIIIYCLLLVNLVNPPTSTMLFSLWSPLSSFKRAAQVEGCLPWHWLLAKIFWNCFLSMIPSMLKWCCPTPAPQTVNVSFSGYGRKFLLQILAVLH